MLGIKKEEIDNLIELDQSKFVYKEWVAFKYAQEWAFSRGREPLEGITEEYKKLYTEEERQYHLKLLRWMIFWNYVANMIMRIISKSDRDAARKLWQANE